MRKILLLLALTATLVLIVVSARVNRVLSRELRLPQAGLVHEVSEGVTFLQFIDNLAAMGVVSSTWEFRVYERYSRSEGLIQTGEYHLRSDMTGYELVEVLRQGLVIRHAITFLEGWRFVDIMAEIQRHGGLHKTLNAASDTEVMARLGYPEEKPEGRFFPDTYFYIKGVTDLTVLRGALERMTSILNAEWQTRRADLPLSSIEEALILASIVEKETGLDDDRKVVASVFSNRLKRGMKLQSDPTVIYGLGVEWSGDLTRRTLAKDTPYNTYRTAGLPPTPIASPGLKSIQAVLNPAETDFLYFVARGDGSSQFSNTLEEHNKAVKRYQKSARRREYRSTPVAAPCNGRK